MRDSMSSRERWLAALDSKPVDRLPFWPKLNGAYARAQAAPFVSMTPDAIFDWIGSDKHGSVVRCVKETRSKTSVEVKKEGNRTRETLITPHGSLEIVKQHDEATQSWHPVRMPVQKAEDIKILREWFEDVSVEFDPAALAKSEEQRKQIRNTALVTSSIGTTALMDWIEHFAGVENGHYMLMDNQDEVEALFAAMHRIIRRRAEIALSHTQADMFYITENTSTTLISPDQYRKYCFKHIKEIADIAVANKKRIVLHMCGLLKDVLPDLNKLPVHAFEAFTSPPVGNTTLMDGRKACPKICLIGGTNATLWTYPAKTIIAELDNHLGQLPHHRGLIITSAGVMPPRATPETIKAVCDWVKAYPARM